MQFGSLRRRTSTSEEGYILLIFLVVLTLMMIALTAAAPRLVQQIKRDREIEMIHRGDQYARAIKRYYKKFGRYPGRIEDLENTNTLRFLRKRYTDPITGGPWRLVRFGEIQMTAGGAGGVGTPAAALGQAGNNLQPGAAQAGAQSGSLFNLNFSGTPGQPGQAANPTAAGGTTAGTGTTATGTTGTTDSSGQTGLLAQGGAGSPGQTGAPGQTTAAAPGQTTSSSSSLFSSPASSAQPGMAGGGAIIGVASLSKANGIHEFNQKSAYKDWFFVYDPGQDRGQLLRGPYNPQAFFGQATTPTGATPAGQAAPGGIGNPSGTGMPGATGMPSGTPSTTPAQPPVGNVPSTQ